MFAWVAPRWVEGAISGTPLLVAQLGVYLAGKRGQGLSTKQWSHTRSRADVTWTAMNHVIY